MKRHDIGGALALAVAGLLLFAPANAQMKTYWTAYAYDASTGAWGLGWGLTDRRATMDMALSNCRRPGC